MIQKEITYENPFNGQKVTETHYFHISKADLVEMEIEEHGTTYSTVVDGEQKELTGMQAKLQRIVDTEDGRAIMIEFKDIIRRSYGVKEGERFVKTEENWKDFSSSEAFSQLLFELCTQPDAAAEFINGVVPSNLDEISAEVQQQAEKIAAGREAQAKAKTAATPAEGDTPAEGHPSDPAATPVTATLAERIEAATSENPVTLTQSELADIDSDTLKSGLATGRIKTS